MVLFKDLFQNFVLYHRIVNGIVYFHEALLLLRHQGLQMGFQQHRLHSFEIGLFHFRDVPAKFIVLTGYHCPDGFAICADDRERYALHGYRGPFDVIDGGVLKWPRFIAKSALQIHISGLIRGEGVRLTIPFGLSASRSRPAISVFRAQGISFGDPGNRA